jgi:cell division septation protein DedD
MGVLGIIVGVLTAIPLLGGAPVVQLFWLVAMAMLFLGRWPQGRGPAWDSGEAIPWPSAADKRDELRGDDAPARARPTRGRAAAAPEIEEEADDEPLHTREAARPRASAEHPRSKKRKRKRRG